MKKIIWRLILSLIFDILSYLPLVLLIWNIFVNHNINMDIYTFIVTSLAFILRIFGANISLKYLPTDEMLDRIDEGENK